MPKRTTQAELDRRRSEALAMKVAGYTLREIAEQLFVSHETIRKDIRIALDKAKADWTIENERFKTLTLTRLDELFIRAWPASIADPPDQDAFDRVMRVMALQCEIHGLIMPRVQRDNDEPD